MTTARELRASAITYIDLHNEDPELPPSAITLVVETAALLDRAIELVEAAGPLVVLEAIRADDTHSDATEQVGALLDLFK